MPEKKTKPKKAATKKVAEIPSIPEGTFMGVVKVAGGWVAKQLTIKDGELTFVKLHDPCGLRLAQAKAHQALDKVKYER